MTLTSVLTDLILITEIAIIIFGLLIYRQNRRYGLYLAIGFLLLVFIRLLEQLFISISSDLTLSLTLLAMILVLYATWLLFRKKF